MTDAQIQTFIEDLGKIGFVWQFITLAGEEEREGGGEKDYMCAFIHPSYTPLFPCFQDSTPTHSSRILSPRTTRNAA